MTIRGYEHYVAIVSVNLFITVFLPCVIIINPDSINRAWSNILLIANLQLSRIEIVVSRY